MNDNINNLVTEYAQESSAEQLELLRSLGCLPAPSHHEDMRAAFCRDWFLLQGATDVTIDQIKNVICKIGCTPDKKILIFAAHMDVVFPDMESLEMKEDEQKIWAPGIGDDTANLVNLMMAAKYLIKNNVSFPYGIMIVANSCEEGLGNLEGTKALFSSYGPRIHAFYSFDGYLSQCCSSAVGSHRYQITCNTGGGHSFVDFGEPNAIAILCNLVNELYQIAPPTEAKTTYNVGKIQGGTTVNSIAQQASILYEFRSTSQHCLDTMETLFHKALEKAQNEACPFTVKLLGVRPSNGPVNQAELRQFTTRSSKVIESFYDGVIDFSAYSTDSNIPLSLGIIANTIGTIIGGGAHTREEWVDKESLKTGVKIILSLMLEYAEKF